MSILQISPNILTFRYIREFDFNSYETVKFIQLRLMYECYIAIIII